MFNFLPRRRVCSERRLVSLFALWTAVSHLATSLSPFSIRTVPVTRAADSAKAGTGRVWLSPNDPCLVLGEDTKFKSEFSPRMQIMLPKSLNSAVAEVSEVISDTELRVKREFGGESGKGTARIREKLKELRQQGIAGLEFKKLPFIDQQVMYRHVYQCLRQGGSIGIFPEGQC